MDTMKINDIEYVKKEEYDKLKVLSEKEKPFDLYKYFIVEDCNVCAIVPFNRDITLDDDMLEIPEGAKEVRGFYKRVEQKDIKTTLNKDLTLGDYIMLSKSKYSSEYVKKTQKTAKHLFDDDAVFYLRFDKEKQEFIEHVPCLIRYDKLVFMLAPRVESEDN